MLPRSPRLSVGIVGRLSPRLSVGIAGRLGYYTRKGRLVQDTAADGRRPVRRRAPDGKDPARICRKISLVHGFFVPKRPAGSIAKPGPLCYNSRGTVQNVNRALSHPAPALAADRPHGLGAAPAADARKDGRAVLRPRRRSPGLPGQGVRIYYRPRGGLLYL